MSEATNPDPIKKIAQAVENGSADVSITELPFTVKVGIRAEEGSEYFAAINGEKSDQARAFLETYRESVKELHSLHTDREHDTPEWCYDVGEVIYELRNEQGRTKSEVELFLKPLADHDDISFSKWKMFNVESVYELFPNKSELPDVDLNGGGSKFGLLCSVADTPDEIHTLFSRVDPDEIAHIERKVWGELKDNDSTVELEEVTEMVNDFARDSHDKFNRRVTAVTRVYKMIGEEEPDESNIEPLIDC